MWKFPEFGNPGFPLQTLGLHPHPTFFQVFEAEGNYITEYYTVYIQYIVMVGGSLIPQICIFQLSNII
jgi:hypothetical protein